jgi:superfamily II DNA or RNA helicase
MKIKSIKKINRNKEDVFNLEVKDNNNYFANSLLVSNCHGIRKNNNINKIFTLLKTPYTFGFTGTMPPSLIDQWNILGKFGPVNYEEKTINLEKKQYISSFQIIIIKIKHKKIPSNIISLDRSMESYKKELEFLFMIRLNVLKISILKILYNINRRNQQITNNKFIVF